MTRPTAIALPVNGIQGSASISATHSITPLRTTNPVVPVHFETDGECFYLGLIHQPRVVWTGTTTVVNDEGLEVWVDPLDQPYLRGSYFEYLIINLDGSLKQRRTFTYPESVTLDATDPLREGIAAAYDRFPYAYATRSFSSNLLGFNPYIDLSQELQNRLWFRVSGGNSYGFTNDVHAVNIISEPARSACRNIRRTAT